MSDAVDQRCQVRRNHEPSSSFESGSSSEKRRLRGGFGTNRDFWNYQSVRLAKACEDAEDEADVTVPSVATCAPPPPPSASASVTYLTLRIPSYKKIKLTDLFLYPAPGTLADELEFFWNGGINGLDEEETSLAAEAESATAQTGDTTPSEVISA
ncbi:hypothetical protein B0H10DRAFT_1964941 [Mycena sp. CBHHK59/15]|nr:hypothetical protein B0H10DRAFT_1964941 [Mycena sp. CBHHK59/15]